MRNTSQEQIDLIVYYSNNGAPATGLSVTLDAWLVSDNSQVITAQACTEIAGGGYKYPKASMPSNISNDALFYRFDGSATLANPDRYKVGVLNYGGYPDSIVQIAGDGAIMVNHDVANGSNVDLTVTDANGIPVEGATIYILLASVWNNGDGPFTIASHKKAYIETDVNGEWKWDAYLDAGNYVALVDHESFDQRAVTVFTVA